MNIKKLINWKLYFILLLASMLSIIAVMPYILTAQADVFENIPMPMPVIITVIILQSTVMFAVFLFIGLMLSKKLGLSVPILEGYIAKKKIETDIRPVIRTSASLGIITGIAIVLLDLLFAKLGLEPILQVPIPVWQGFLASFYGGISEEIVMRLFFMSFIAWLIGKIIRPKTKVIDNSPIMWSSIIIAALIFGLGHLPITASMTAITPLVIIRALVLNGIGGIVFGWLYWKKGLESAMIAHFSADIILHVLVPFFLLF